MQKPSREFTNLINALASTFGAERDEALFLGYWMGLHDIPISDLEKGIQRGIRESTFMPKPAEIRQLCGELTAKQHAILAWQHVPHAVLGIGKRTFDDPLMEIAVQALGGWQHLGDMPQREFNTWARQQFIQTYENLFDIERSKPKAISGSSQSKVSIEDEI